MKNYPPPPLSSRKYRDPDTGDMVIYPYSIPEGFSHCPDHPGYRWICQKTGAVVQDSETLRMWEDDYKARVAFEEYQQLPAKAEAEALAEETKRKDAERSVKQMALEALNQLGGTLFLIELGKTEPKTFATLLSKLLTDDSEQTSKSVVYLLEKDQAL